AINAELSAPNAIAIDPGGNLYIADSNNSAIRRVDATSQIITTVAGTGTAGYTSGDWAYSAQIGNPYGLGIDSAGNLYTADYTNFVVQKITMRGQSFTFPATNVGQQSAPLLPTIVIANIGNE